MNFFEWAFKNLKIILPLLVIMITCSIYFLLGIIWLNITIVANDVLFIVILVPCFSSLKFENGPKKNLRNIVQKYLFVKLVMIFVTCCFLLLVDVRWRKPFINFRIDFNLLFFFMDLFAKSKGFGCC